MLDLGWATSSGWWWAAMTGATALVVIAVALVRQLAVVTRRDWSQPPSPERVLAERLVRGEISVAEYTMQRDLLRS